MTEPKRDWRKIKYYPVSMEKLEQASMKEAAYLIAPMNIGEDYEYFDKVKHLLVIPEEPKSLDEISQELDEKFEKLIERTKGKFECCIDFAKDRHNRNFDKIIGNFEYAKTQGYFPKVDFISSGTLDYSKLSVNIGSNISSPCFMVKHGSNHQGYYTIGDDGYYRFYVEKKPNVVFRWFVYKLMGFKWIDEVL
jgi:hypothetical protein